MSGTNRVSWYQKKQSPTHHPNHHPIVISFFYLLQSIASSLFKLRAWQSFCTTPLRVLFGLPLGLEPSTPYSIHSSHNQCLLFATHAHTIATYFAAVSILVHGQVTIIFAVSVGLSVCLFVCLFVQFLSAVFDPISIKLGHMLCIWV